VAGATSALTLAGAVGSAVAGPGAGVGASMFVGTVRQTKPLWHSALVMQLWACARGAAANATTIRAPREKIDLLNDMWAPWG
jgi:hypothetical protein